MTAMILLWCSASVLLAPIVGRTIRASNERANRVSLNRVEQGLPPSAEARVFAPPTPATSRVLAADGLAVARSNWSGV